MTELAFHFNAPDRLAYACRLLRKAVSNGAKVLVIAQEDSLRELDVALWTFSATDFVPHCHINIDPQTVNRSPVILAGTTQESPHHHILLNLGDGVPIGFEKFERVIEVVAIDDEGRLMARARWKHYTNLGYAITRHDLNLKPA